MEHNFISERRIYQGDLILMIHKEHPTKSGWWRKIRDRELKDIYYILEKPIHKEYDLASEDLKETHQENNCFVVKANTISYEQKYGDIEKYDILLSIRGTDAVNLVIKNYDFNCVDINSNNVDCTKGFIEFLEYYNKRYNKNNILKQVANNCI
ncbi:MAG: hypothetical protein ACRC1T_05195 [Clostridium chrysemydis]|uniref:hypothetical protein n=1 Tax=Clostridium chrysemydis TaxID=2665504 RepID=UPI003F3B1BD0